MRFRSVEVSLLLTSDREIRKLNQKYRKENRPTDVLSFAQEENTKSGKRQLLGDIVISVPTARRQAKRAGHDLEQECNLLAVHGLLHLLGHDHARASQARKMFSLQTRILRKVARHA